MVPGISALLSKNGAEIFLEDHWPHLPFVVHDQNKNLASLKNLPFLRSLDDLLAAWPNKVQAHLPDLSDEASSVDVSPSDAKKLFQNKMGLLFNHVERLSPELTHWISALRKDLGMPTMTFGRCLVYATPDGKGTAPHFDQNINFVFQIQGIKKWKLAVNRNVPNPTQRHTLGQTLDPELQAYADLPLPMDMPKDAEEIQLSPGSLLFVPRGYWHSTEAEGESLALNFTFNQPTWIDLMTAALKSRLSLSPEWRELADGVSSSDPEKKQCAQRKFDLLLLELVEDLPNWRAEDILTAIEGL